MTKPASTTEILRELAAVSEGSITLETLIASLGDRSYGLAVLVLCLPNLIPLVPGFASICAVPMFIIACQLTMGKPCIRLPSRVARISLSRSKLSKILLRCLPFLTRLEQVIKPRLAPFTGNSAEKLIGIIWAVLAGVIFLPIPFGDPIPSFCAILLALGVLEKDGMMVICGIITSAATIYGMWVLIVNLLEYAWKLASGLF